MTDSLTFSIRAPGALTLGVEAPDTLALGIDGFAVVAQTLPEYTGAVEVTPSPETQVLETEGKSVYSNITVNPIPSNYGLVTWNGSVLTVS